MKKSGLADRAAKSAWMERFGAELLRLMPTMSPLAAATYSYHGYSNDPDLRPETAAHQLATKLRPRPKSTPARGSKA
jgi:hypothetical protein